MIDIRHRVEHYCLRKAAVYLTVFAAVTGTLTAADVSAEPHSPGVIYQNSFNFGIDSMIDSEVGTVGEISFNQTDISDSETGNNIGIGVSSDSWGNYGTISFSFKDGEARDCGTVGYCFDISRGDTEKFQQTDSPIMTSVTLNKGFVNEARDYLYVSDKVIANASDKTSKTIDDLSAADYCVNKIYHVQQILDLDNKKIYTLVDGKPLTYVKNGEEVKAAGNLPEDFVLKNINVNLSMTAVYFDNFRIEDLSSCGGTFDVSEVTNGDDNHSIYVTFSEPICAESCAEDNFEITTSDNKRIEINAVHYVGCCCVRLDLAEDTADKTVFVSVKNTASHTISNGCGATLGDNQNTHTAIFNNPIIYDNDFAQLDGDSPAVVSLECENSNVQNTDGWIAEQDENGNVRMKLDKENQLTVFNNCMYKNFALSFDIQPKQLESDGGTYETSVNLSYVPDGSASEKQIKVFSLIRKYIKITDKYQSLITNGTGSGQRIPYECGQSYHIDTAYNPQRNTIYLYVDGECIGELAVGEDINFKKLVMNFGRNTDYLDSLKIYEFNSRTQNIRITDAKPKSNTITIQTAEPLNANEITNDSFAVSTGSENAEISDVLLKDNNTTVVITLAQPIDGGRNYSVTAKSGLKNFANMAAENDLTATVAVPRAVMLSECTLDKDGRMIQATVQNNESGRSTAVLVVCSYSHGSNIPDKILTDSAFDTDTHSQIGYLEPNETGILRITADFSGADRIYAYLWENTGNCIPYCRPVCLKP